VFTIQPLAERTSADDPREYDDADVDKEFNLRLPVKAGAHEVAAAFLNKPAAVLETVRQPYPVAFNMDRHLPGSGPPSIRSPLPAHSTRAAWAIQRVAAGSLPAGRDHRHRSLGCAKRIIATLTRRAYRRPVTDEDLKTPLAFYEQGYAEGRVRNGRGNRAAKNSHRTRVPLPRRAGSLLR
jgi:hypothetical protein